MTSSEETADRLQGLADELEYWRTELGGRGELPESIQRRLDPATRREQCHYRVAEYVKLGAQRFPDVKLRVLDVGSGPLSTIAWIADEGLAEVEAVDPLAREYNALLESIGLAYPVLPREGRCEDLSALFAPNTFHLVYSRNALDHVSDPQRCLDEIWNVLTPGGAVLIDVTAYEGARQSYGGLHGFDFFCRGGKLHCEDRDGRSRLEIDESKFSLEVLAPLDSKPWNGDETPDPDPLASSIHACMVKR